MNIKKIVEENLLNDENQFNMNKLESQDDIV